MINYKGESSRPVALKTLLANIGMMAVALLPSASWAASTAGTIFDASGDSISHDIESVSAIFDAANLHLHATFRQGTLDSSDLAFIVFFDLDQDSATGAPSSASISTGAEIGVSFNSQRNPGEVQIRRDAAPVSFGVNSFSFTLPLSVLDDDGHANFSIVLGDPTSDSTFFGRDFAPDRDIGSPLSTSTQFVPEPRSGAIALLGLLSLIAGVARAGRT